MSFIGILIILLGVGFIIFVHELGHFLFAKKVGVRVEIFSLGFGPRIIGFNRGETEYRISAIPLGGYVKLAGGEQADPDKKYESYELPGKSVFQRFQIFFAGSLMNFLFAFPLGILAFVAGVYVPGNTVGSVRPETQEWRAGIRTGDTIIAINGREIKNFEEYKKTVLRTSVGETLHVKVVRNGQELTFDLVAQGSKKILPITDYGCIVAKISENSVAYKAGLRADDEVIKVNGRRVMTIDTMNSVIMENPEAPITLLVIRKSGSPPKTGEKEISFKLERRKDENGKDVRFFKLNVQELITPQIGLVNENGPAGKAGFMPDDIVIAVNGEKIRNWSEMSRKVRSSPEKELIFTVKRGAEEKELKAVPYRSAEGNGTMDFTLKNTDVIAELGEDSIFFKAGMRGGDIVANFNHEEISSVLHMQEYFKANTPVKIGVDRAGRKLEFSVVPVDMEYDYEPFAGEWTFHKTYKKFGLIEAVPLGVSDTLDWSLMTFQILWKLFKGDESPKDLAGPIGIFHMAYLTVTKEGLGRFLWLLMLICVNLAVVNMLPIPIMDGGLIMFLIIEKIKGRPVSEKTMAIAQYAGLVMVVMLFLYVTYRDAFRIFTNFM